MKFKFRYLIIVVALLALIGCAAPTDLSKCKMLSKTFDYDGQQHSLKVINVPSEATIIYKNNNQKEVGSYKVVADVSMPNGEKKTLEATLTIVDPNASPLDECMLLNRNVVYNGEEQYLTVRNLPEGATVEYYGNGVKDAGKHKVTAVVTLDSYVKELSAYINIEKAEPEFTFEKDQTFIMVGSKAFGVEASVNNDEQVIIAEPMSEITGPGNYRVKISVDSSKNYKSGYDYLNVTVIKNTLDVEFEDETFVADGTVKSLKLVGESLEGYTVEYVNNEQTEPGKYNVKALIKTQDGEVYCTVYGVLEIDKPDNQEFNEFMDELFVAIFAGDQMSINFFFKNPADYGLDHYEAELPYATFDNFEEGQQQLLEILDALYEFEYDSLSAEQQMSYKVVEDYFVYLSSITEPMDYMTNGYLGSYLGYQANLPLNLAEYKFRNEQDIKDFISYLYSAEEAFKTYYQFCVKQNEYGFGLTDIAIDNVVSQCEKFVAEKDNHYLIDIFNDKIDNIEFELAADVVEAYKAECKSAIQNQLCNAYQYVADNLPNLKGADIIEGGLYHYGEEGLEYFELMFRDTVGYSDLTIEEAIAYVDYKMKEANDILDDIVVQFRGLTGTDYNDFYYAAVEGDPVFTDKTPMEIVELFQELAKQIVPELDVMPEISIKYVYESLEENFSPAAYFVSPLDETRFESIYLNGLYTDDVNYIFTTLAHEGYPGHLYQNVYAKQLDISNVRKILRCSGYMEGWATYVELKAYDWAPDYTSKGHKLALEYLKYNDILNGMLSCRVDLGIHGQGWMAEDIANYLNEFFQTNAYTTEDMQDFYDQVVEIPTNMSQYFFSYSKLQDMHDRAEEMLGWAFDEIEFNKVLLDCGAAPLEYVEEAVEEYILDTLYEWGAR
ncbi:MAG: DUF885 domain-containing protein [Bacilli bacterium]|nr:DUF885 domain-containing protein [Bacilli bacterium]